MGKHNKRSVGSSDSLQRISNRFYKQSTKIRRHCGYKITVRYFLKKIPVRGGRFFVTKRCHRISFARTKQRGILQSSICNPKKGWWQKNDIECQAPEQICKKDPIQNANYKLCIAGLESRRLGSKNRFKGCVPSDTNASRSQKVPEIFNRGKMLPVQNPLLWSCNSTQSIHKNNVGIRSVLSQTSDSCVPIPRRLAHCREKQRGNTESSQHGLKDGIRSRTSNKLGEVSDKPNPDHGILGHKLQPGTRDDKTNRGKIQKSNVSTEIIQTRQRNPSQNIFTSPRSNGSMHNYCTMGSSVYETNPNVPLVSMASSQSIDRKIDNSVSKSHSSLNLVEERRKFFQGSESGKPKFANRNDNRRIKSRVGRTHRQQPKQRNVAPKFGKIQTHKLARNASSTSRTERFCEPSTEQNSISKIRQHHCSVIHKQVGGDKVARPMLPSLGTVELVQRPQDNVESISHSRQVKCNSRPFIKGNRHKTDRMVLGEPSGKSDISNMGTSTHRSVRIQSEQETPDILFSSARSPCPGNRCIHDFLGRPDRVCLPSSDPIIKNSKEDKNRRLCDNTDSSMLAKTVVVPNNVGINSGTATKTTNKSRPPITESRKGLPSQPRISRLNSMETVQAQTIKKGFSTRTASIMAAARRPSTSKTYDARLKRFYNWCDRGNINPRSATVTQIADFLQELFDKENFCAATIAGYRAAISLVHRGINGTPIGQDKDLGILLAGMSRLRPRKRVLIPNWSLPLVLNILSKEPFEPLETADIKFVTLKTVFLVAITSGRRVSEIHALSTDKSHLRWECNGKGVRLLTNPKFMAKNESLKNPGKDIFLSSFDHFASSPEEKCMCPCRALSIYLDRTKAARNSCSQLFLTYKKGAVRQASKDTIARWIVETVKTAYAMAGDEDIELARAHDTRSLSTSWALFQGVKLDEIMRAAFWSAETTFTTFYMRDVLWDDAAFSLAALDTSRAGNKLKKLKHKFKKC